MLFYQILDYLPDRMPDVAKRPIQSILALLITAELDSLQHPTFTVEFDPQWDYPKGGVPLLKCQGNRVDIYGLNGKRWGPDTIGEVLRFIHDPEESPQDAVKSYSAWVVSVVKSTLTCG